MCTIVYIINALNKGFLVTRPGKRRLAAYIDEELYQEVKKIADKRHMKITGLIIEAIKQRMAWEKKYD